MFQDYAMERVRRDRDEQLLRNAERQWLVKGVSSSQTRFRKRLHSAVTRLAHLWARVEGISPSSIWKTEGTFGAWFRGHTGDRQS